ncbi:MAG: prolipoprotein diacylglyceryl transferase [Solobacterium sp.]|nr:prolipoprotein diacylglyceryl transferase [Solobacterium sp.]
MHNDWLKIGGLTIHGYGVMIALGILAAFVLAEKLAEKKDLDKDNIDNMIFFCLVLGYICAKLTYVIVTFDEFIKDPLSVLGSGGWVVYGGIIGGVFAGWLWCRKHNWDFMHYFNVLIPCVALAQGFGRIGCFFAGCCYGMETDLPIGLVFPPGSLAPAGVRLLPTQLMSSLFDFILFFILYRNLMKGRHPEKTAALYLVIYSAGRFLIEFVRGDAARGFIGVLSTSQLIALFTGALGIYLITRNNKGDKEKTV